MPNENTEKRKAAIVEMCDTHGCSDKIRKIHFDQYVHRNWHPHPPAEFSDWWKKHPDCIHNGIDFKRAFNCQNYYQEYLEARSIGVA